MHKSFFMNYVRACVGNSLQYFFFLKSEWYKYIFGTEKCKVTFGFKYILRAHRCLWFATLKNTRYKKFYFMSVKVNK